MKKLITGFCIVLLMSTSAFQAIALENYDEDKVIATQFSGDETEGSPVVQGGWTCSDIGLSVNGDIIHICNGVSCTTDQDCRNWGKGNICLTCDIQVLPIPRLTGGRCEDPTSY